MSELSKVEQRAWSILVAICLFLGAWWLQNQYNTMIKIQEQLGEYMRFVDDKYVEKDYLHGIENRLGRIETKIDKISANTHPAER